VAKLKAFKELAVVIVVITGQELGLEQEQDWVKELEII
jgi:hypothetical protein